MDRRSVPWANIFCGRTRELDALMQAYRRVESGQGPEICVLLGESGLGKTRLIQEFYARLSTSVDLEGEAGYWPDRLTRQAHNLKINPDPAACNLSRNAQMQFLWCGLRMLDQDGRNSGMAGLHEAISFLKPHLEPFARARQLSDRIRGAAKRVAVDTGVELGNLVTFGLLGFGQLGLEHLKEWKGIADDRRALDEFEIGAAKQEQKQSLVDIAIQDLATRRCQKKLGVSGLADILGA